MTDAARPPSRRLTGRCLCGTVCYQVADAFEYAMNCHCSDCRRATGSAFKPFAGIRREHLAIAAGADATLIYGDASAAHDVHCRRCGSLLFSVVRDGAYAHVTMGTLVDAPSIRPSMHMFVVSKAPWHDITDDLPQHARFPGE
ncbi:Glutathione-dependent formaldehyde-activating GFA [Bradyrhizobium sp. STM 3843]|uniref:GFA family protein n=1 Tax=Bradyrhizobium sp. STM 3843 TaxID=551947 RepID=UPI0002404391|nr:GFA family protein [Bradyrhizobium sp. STM 3843]CCE10414.1 Glutathione-dependent formaldehyde-activating GFA [Bradyrhizobium sp. STM 3843]